VKSDLAKARAWFDRGAELGNGDSMSHLGEMYSGGIGVPKDEAKGVEWYKKGVEHESFAAMNNLAICYLYGIGVAKNASDGLALLRRAAEEDPIGQENLAKLERSGEFGEKRPQEAIPLFEKAAAHGSTSSMLSMAEMYRNGEGTKPDIGLACRWALIAHLRGNANGTKLAEQVCKKELSKDQLPAQVAEAKQWVDQNPDAFGTLSRP
jgi:TPR repeat protein